MEPALILGVVATERRSNLRGQDMATKDSFLSCTTSLLHVPALTEHGPSTSQALSETNVPCPILSVCCVYVTGRGAIPRVHAHASKGSSGCPMLLQQSISL